MKTCQYGLIMWGPFSVLFTLAGFGLEVLEGNKITTSAYMGLRDLGLTYLFIIGAIAFMLYPVSFLPLTWALGKFVKSLLFQTVVFTSVGGGIGAMTFSVAYNVRFIEAYNLRMVCAVILFSLAGLLYALIENAVKRHIQFA